MAADGRIILVTDDVMDSATERQQTLMRPKRERFRFGKYRTLHCSEGGTFNGRRTKMGQDFSARVNMSTYIRQELLDVYLSPTRELELQNALSHAERSFFPSGTMAVMWCARKCRSEALGTASTLSQVFGK